MKLRHLKKLTALTAALWIIQVEHAYAYMDPGTGSLLLQGLLGGIAGAAVFIRIYWHKLISWFGWRKPVESENDND